MAENVHADMMNAMNGSGDAMASMMSAGMMSADMMHAGMDKRVEPLFVAMASFVGMAMVITLSILFLPKFGNTHSRDVAALKNAPDDDMVTLSQVIGEAIEGKDCADRIACELGKAIRSMKLGDKPIRVLEVMLPPKLSKQMAQIRKSATRKEKCHFIPCKHLQKNKPKQKQKP